jgi:U3 small nucleolar RNA-associated protein 22
VWIPTNPRKWKPNVGFSSLPMPKEDDEEGELTVGLNKAAVLNEVARIGGELVKGITVNRE